MSIDAAERQSLVWPEGLSRVPYWVFQRDDIYRNEQQLIFRGNCWNYLCLEGDVAKAGDFRTTFVGEMPVIVVRGDDGEVHAFENRCAHRGALICLEDGGSAKDFSLRLSRLALRPARQPDRGRVPARRQRQGRHGEETSTWKPIGPRKLRTATFCGLVFGTLLGATPADRGLSRRGDRRPRIARVLTQAGRCIGRFIQPLPNNWKLYMENVKDTYHASLLHLFFTTFRITRLSQGGGVMVSESGAHHASTHDGAGAERDTTYRDAGLRSDSEVSGLPIPALLEIRDEWGDGIQLQILQRVPRLRPAADPQLPGGAPDRAARRRCDGSALDLSRLRRRYAGHARAAAEAVQPGRAGRLRLDGRRLRRRLRAARHRRRGGRRGGGRDGRRPAPKANHSRATEAAVRGFWKEWRR